MIGFFDSGVGGLNVTESVHTLLPSYDTIYLGDTANSPYGNKHHDQLVDLTWKGCQWLFNQGAELIILACNSASASALREIQQTKGYAASGKRILGIIRPTAGIYAKNGYKNVLVLSTTATKKSGAYETEFKNVDPAIGITVHTCPKWASMIEQGLAKTEEMKVEVFRELETIKKDNYDAVLLACTHYPFIRNHIREFFGSEMIVSNQGPIIAASLSDYLKRHPEMDQRLSKKDRRLHYTTAVIADKHWAAFPKFKIVAY